MKEFLTQPIAKNVSRIALLVFIILGSLLFIYRVLTYTYLTVEFNQARPVRNKIPVYYKGYRIGKVEKIKPSKDFLSTNVTIVLYPRHLKLPINTTALLAREKRGEHFETDFINLIYPDEPSTVNLKSGDSIIGVTTIDIESFFSEKAINGELDIITKNVNTLLEELQSTSKALSQLMGVLQDTVDENRPSIKTMTSNLASMSDELKSFAQKLNNSLDDKEIKSTLTNFNHTSSSIVTTSENLENITKNIDEMTTELNKETRNITGSIKNANKISRNIEEITTGLKNTMSKNFAGFRLIFGKPIQKVNCKQLCD